MFAEIVDVVKKVADSVKENGEQVDPKTATEKMDVSESEKIQHSENSIADSFTWDNPFGENLAPSDEVKYQMIADEINNMDEFRFENWSDLSEEEKVATLQELENISAEISHRPACKIAVKDLGPVEEYNGNFSGYFGQHENAQITINSELLNFGSPEALKKVVETILHEGRHEYQTHNVALLLNGESPTERSLELVKAWHINMNELGYKDGECPYWDVLQIGHKEYLAQPVEVDARVFAENVLDKTDYFA